MAAEVRGLIAQGLQLESQLTQGAAAIHQQLSADEEGANQAYQMVVSEFNTAKSQTLSALSSADAQTNATLDQARANDQTELSKVETQISKITQQVQTQANAAQTSDNLSLSTATAQIAASERKLQLVSSAAAKLKQGALQAESTFAQGLNQALAGGRTQHEKDWQTNLNKVMAALAGETLSAHISNAASYYWNIYVSLNLGQLQGVLNDLVLVGNTVIKSDELFLSPAGTDWLGKVFGITNLAIPSARGLIIDEPDWEYTWSQRFANAGIVLVSLEMPQGPAKLESEAYTVIGSTGKIGENALKALGGESQAFFRTTTGPRYVDQLANGIANESKVGYQSLTSTIRRQIAKDIELIQTRQIDGATWHFFRSPVTGLVGPSKQLLEALTQAGIKVIIH